LKEDGLEEKMAVRTEEQMEVMKASMKDSWKEAVRELMMGKMLDLMSGL